MHRTTILLPEDLDRRLTETARRRGGTRSDVIRLALIEHLEGETRPRPTSIGRGVSGGNVNSETIKAVVRAEWGRRAKR